CLPRSCPNEAKARKIELKLGISSEDINNSSPRPPEELNSKISIESFYPSPIPVEDSDSLMEEIDTFIASNDSIPPSIDSDGNGSKECCQAKLMMLDNAAEAILMLLSHINVVEVKLMLSRQS
nr:hypothetical protein [Tanacetum cinerariifolium]